jgi:CoA:oxalate CoA-transferase
VKALEEIVVLDLTRVLAGPYAAMVLADFGANVIKIEPPVVGDDSRAFGPFVGKESVYFMSLNRGKRSLTLNLKEPEGVSLFKELVKKADVVLENYRPGTMEKLGIGYEELRKINPGIVYAACSGFGHSGPYSTKPAYDVIVQGMGGIMSITGQENGEPTRVGASVGDITAGLFTVIGIMMGLYQCELTGVGQKVDVAMLDCQVAILENAIARYLVSGSVPQPIGNRHPSITPFEAFKACDGYVIIAVGNDKLWAEFCKLIERPDLVSDPRFINNPSRTAHQKDLKAILDKVFLTKTVAQWLEELDKAGIPCGPINSVDQVMADPQVLARNMIVETNHPVAGPIKMAGIPIKLSETPGSVDIPAPLLGQHTDEILKQFLFMSDEEISRLKQAAVL